MRVNTELPLDVSASTVAALMRDAFMVSVGFGVVFPLLLYLIDRLRGVAVATAQVSRHTGLLREVRLA